ncbi:hypothetical protein TNCV_2891761 [Trichonephila clavipes]|nr:hypothetical protein TNCV_2891761 [Trichonephila clavipes]
MALTRHLTERIFFKKKKLRFASFQAKKVYISITLNAVTQRRNGKHLCKTPTKSGFAPKLDFTKVNGDRYRAMITNFFIPELNNHHVQELWFQQDGATCHTARATIDLLKDTFGDRLISRFVPVN